MPGQLWASLRVLYSYCIVWTYVVGQRNLDVYQ